MVSIAAGGRRGVWKHSSAGQPLLLERGVARVLEDRAAAVQGRLTIFSWLVWARIGS